ncbi:SWIM zinc finger family protein [Haloarcula salina]|uniref:SWIM zinc finger family protein n=1 Tax=Haloarcula salina TaxID=1429914 RepID=UPI003C6F3EF0
MENEDTAAEKRTAVDYLSFGEKTAKRVSWEAWEFTVVGPRQVRVTNASYGYLKDEHSYTVEVTAREGLAVPAECECPADKHSGEYDCKHKVALATVGGSTVLDAAVGFDHLAPAKQLKTDGGLHADTRDCDCISQSEFPCWPCYRDGAQ